MPKVLCTLPNASDEISGVKFVSHANGKLSEDLSDEAAAAFAAIPGYQVVGSAPPPPPPQPPAPPATDAEKAALLDRAAAIEFKTKANWSLERLKTEVEAAEKAAADADAAKVENNPPN